MCCFFVDFKVRLFFFFFFASRLCCSDANFNAHFILHNYCAVKYFIAGAPFVILFDLKPLVFEQVQHYLGTPLHWGPGARAPYIVLFDLKLLNEDSNLQLCMYCMHAQKGASEAPRTHYRSCKTSGDMPPDLLPQSILWALLFVFALGPSHPFGGAGYICTLHTTANGCKQGLLSNAR